MASYFPKEDRLYLVTMLLAVSLAIANAVFSIYAVDLLDIYAINVPFSVAYQPVYPAVIFLLVVPVCLFVRSPKPWLTVIAGMVLGLVGGVYANDIPGHLLSRPLATWRTGLNSGDARDGVRGANGGDPLGAA
jgi:hypothetical protein